MEDRGGDASLRSGGETDGADPGPPASPWPPPYFGFSTHDLPQDGKFETWRDLWMKTIEVEVSSPSPDGFNGELEIWNAGPLAIGSVFVKRTLYDRTARLAANGEDAFSFTLCGHSFLVNGEKRVSSGGGFFLSHRQRFTVQASDDCYSCLLKVDRAALLELMPKGFDLHGKVFPANHATLPLIWDMVPLITSKTEPTTATQRGAIGTQIIDLVALVLDPSRDGREQIEKRGLKEARKGAVLRAIDKHFARRELNADLIGRELDISGREVHRLLQETTKTFYEHLLERRLLHANELLHGGPDAKLKIADIAFQSGFADITHFNHAFRRRFGDTPTGVRSAVATERTLHYLRRTVDRPRQNS